MIVKIGHINITGAYKYEQGDVKMFSMVAFDEESNHSLSRVIDGVEPVYGRIMTELWTIMYENDADALLVWKLTHSEDIS